MTGALGSDETNTGDGRVWQLTDCRLEKRELHYKEQRYKAD